MLDVDHPEVVRARKVVRVRLPDPRVKHVLVVETRMPISAQDVGFDQEEYGALVEAVRTTMDRGRMDEAEIVSI